MLQKFTVGYELQILHTIYEYIRFAIIKECPIRNSHSYRHTWTNAKRPALITDVTFSLK